MEYNHDKVDEVALALLYLTLGSDNRAWKGMAWEVSDRLFEKGWIEDPRNKNKSFVLTRAGREACIRFFKQYFWESDVSMGEDGSPSNLFPLPIDLQLLIWAYQISEDGMAGRLRYLDSATGEFLGDKYDDSGTLQPIPDLSSDPRYLPLPNYSDAEYLGDASEFIPKLRENDLKERLTALLKEPGDTSEIRAEIRSLLRNHDKWDKWQRKCIRQRLLDWLSSNGIEPG